MLLSSSIPICPLLYSFSWLLWVPKWTNQYNGIQQFFFSFSQCSQLDSWLWKVLGACAKTGHWQLTLSLLMSMLHQRCNSLGTIALPPPLVHLKQVKHKTGENKSPKRTDLKGIESVNQQKKLVSIPFLDILCDFEGYNLPSSALIQQLGIKMGLGSATLIRCERYHQVMILFKKHMFLFRTQVWFGLVVWNLRETFGFHKF